jgi:hypothetical protein
VCVVCGVCGGGGISDFCERLSVVSRGVGGHNGEARQRCQISCLTITLD